MEFWPEHQGHSSLYARFGTVPRRNCAHNYHDRHQTTSYPFSYGEQQDQGRESGYWTVPGLRTGRALQESANWTHSELAAPSSSHFPFILDRQTQPHQDIGVYQPYEVRGREWTAAQRDYDRGFQRERWQRRWEPSSPVRYKREVPTKRSSYQGLEAWAAQYSHSLPRRKNREEELRCTSHGLLETSRAAERNRSGTIPQVSLLQHVRQSADINKSGVWDRPQTLNCPLQVPLSDTSHTLDIKEKAGYQRRMFSHPPGYAAPPPYNSPHKCTPVMSLSNTTQEQGGQRQIYWSQPTFKKQDVSDLQDKNKREKEELTNPDGHQTCAQLEGLQRRTPGPSALKAGSPITVQGIQQHSQMIQSVQNTKATEQASSKVIEGKQFRFNKKTGGMTIFCLVSRIADATETPPWPLCTSQANIQSSDFTEVSEGQRDTDDIPQTYGDEVDFSVATLTEQSASDTRSTTSNANTIPTFTDSLGDNLSKKTETGFVYPENSTSGRQVAQCAHPVPVKYPLWREPSFTCKAESEKPSLFLKADHEGEESGGLHSQEKSATAHPINVEVRRLDIKRDTQSEDSESLLVIDTTCVVVKMELIPPAKKDHVHYLSSKVHAGENLLQIQSSTVPKSNCLLKTEQDSDMRMKQAPQGEGDLSFTCKPSSSFSERETLVECSGRIPGIPLHDSVTEEQSEEAPSLAEPLSLTNDNHARTGQLPDTTEGHLVTCQTEDEAEDQVQNEDGEHFAGPQEQLSALCEEMDNSQLQANVKTSQETEKTEDSQFEPTGEEGTTEENEEENQLVENDPSPLRPYQCERLSKLSLLSHSNLTSLSYISQSTTEQDLDAVVALNPAENLALCPQPSSLPETTSRQQPSPLLPGSTQSSRSSTPHKCHSPSPLPELIDQRMEPISVIEDKDDKNDSSELENDDFIYASTYLEEQEVVSHQQLEVQKSDNDTYGEEKSDNDTYGEEKSDNDIWVENKSDNDTYGEEKSDNDTVREEKSDNDAVGEEKSDNDTVRQEKSDNDTVGEEKSENDTYGEEKSENYTYGEEKSDNDTYGEEKSENDSWVEEKSDNDTVGEEKSDNDSWVEEKSENDTYGEEKSDNDICGEEKSDNDIRGEEKSDNDTVGEEKSDNDIRGEEKSDDTVGEEKSDDTVGEEKSDNDTVGEEKSENDTYGEEKSENYTYGEEKSDNDTWVEEKSDNDTYGEEKSENYTYGEEKSDNDTYGEEKSENYTYGEEKSDNDTVGEEKSENDTYGEEKSENYTYGEEKSDNDTWVEEKSDNDTYGEEKSENDTVREEKSDNDSWVEEKSDNDTVGQEKSDNDSWVEEKSENDTYGEEKSDNDICGEEKSDNDIRGEEKSDDTVGEEHITDEQQREADSDPEKLWEQPLEPSKENPLDVDILPKQAEDITCNEVSHLIKEPLQQEASEDREGVSTCSATEEQSQREEIEDPAADCQIVQEHFFFSQEENVSCVMNSLTAEEQSGIEGDEEQSIPQENPSDCQQVEVEMLQNSGSDDEPSGPDRKVSPSPDVLSPSELPSPSHIQSTTEHFSDCLELNPISADVGIVEKISHSPLFDSCEESSPLPSSSTNELLPDFTPDVSNPPHGGGEDVFFDLPHQYPKSLWDAVNRIRKHTAPDSENEEEEVSEHWDPESIQEGMGFPGAVFNMNSEETAVHQDPSVEEDTLSCSSHSSGDTVIVTEEEEFEEIQLGQVFAAADGERSCFGEVNDETAVKGDMKELCLSEEDSNMMEM